MALKTGFADVGIHPNTGKNMKLKQVYFAQIYVAGV
jgi:hypothetical protein